MKVKYYSGDSILEITIRSETGAREDSYKCNLLDKKSQKAIASILFDKYGIDLTPAKDIKFFEQ